MSIGRFDIEQLSEGFFELFKDGTFSKMDPYRLNNPMEDDSLGRYSSALGIDPLLITDGETNLVIDPGLGWGLDNRSSYKETSNIVTNLNIFGLRPQDIHYVILTHLHYDHVAGATYVSDKLKTTATFPNAKYLIRREEWEFALTQLQDRTPGAGYQLDELYRLVADDRVLFIDNDVHQPVKGVYCMKSGGHTPGHQVVKLQDSGETAYFLGDLIPTEHHLNHYPMKLIDHSPLEAKKAKTLLLKKALREQAQLYFYHSLFNKNGQLAKDRHKNYVLLDKSKM